MSEPAWTKGQPIELLREIAAPFAAHFRPVMHSAFILPKEAEIATAMTAGEAIWTRAGGNGVQAAAIFKIARKAGSRRGFDGREATILPGDLVIPSIAGTDEGRARLIDRLIDDTGAAAVWVEDMVESAASGLWSRMGFDRALTKVAASSDIIGLWQIGDRDGRWPSAPSAADGHTLALLDPEFAGPDDLAAARAEIEAWNGGWAQHYSNYNKRESWTAIAIRGFDADDPGFIIKPSEMSRKWRAENPDRLDAKCCPTVAAPKFPTVRRIIERLPAQPQRIRLMRLAAGGGELTRHADIVDPEAGTADGMTCRIHIPITSPAACRFLAWDQDGHKHDRHFAPGSLFYLDTRKPHAVINPGEADRVHIVADMHSGPELRAMIAASGQE